MTENTTTEPKSAPEVGSSRAEESQSIRGPESSSTALRNCEGREKRLLSERAHQPRRGEKKATLEPQHSFPQEKWSRNKIAHAKNT